VGQYIALGEAHFGSSDAALPTQFGVNASLGGLPRSALIADVSASREEFLHQVGEDIMVGRGFDRDTSV
jgi:hypothetical protein